MNKLFKHTPDIDGFDGQEYAWSIAIGKIKNRKTEWLKIEQRLNKKGISQAQREQFLKNLMNKLIDIRTERFLHREHDKYDNKEQLLNDLKKIRGHICAVQKNFWHREYHNTLSSYISSIAEGSRFSFEDGKNTTAESLKSIEENLELMRKAADQSIKDFTQKETLRPNFATFKKTLKDDLALKVAKELQDIGIRPTKTRNGNFDQIFCTCCDIVELGPNKAGSKHIERAVESLCKKQIGSKDSVK